VPDFLSIALNEGKWLAASMTLAASTVSAMAWRIRHSEMQPRSRTSALMDLFFGITMGTMAFGHLFAVTLKIALGTLEGPVIGLYALGIALALPSWLLLFGAMRRLIWPREHVSTTTALNAWLAGTLLILGLHNLPLAAPGILNIGYQLHSKRLVGWAFVTLAVVLNTALFIAAVIFAASGQSFEQFSGMR
jgi:hypothetical protein